MQFLQLVVDRLGTHQRILVLRSFALLSFLTDPDHHLFDPFRVDFLHLLRGSGMILQARRWRLRFIASNPPMKPATRPLQLPDDLTLLPTLQIQSNGSLAKRNLSLHGYTSWFSHQKV